MELSQLEYFKVVAQHKNLTQAAEALHITQSALSKSMAKLELDLSAPLFDREGGYLRLSKAGRAFLIWCNTALNAIDSGRREIHDISERGAGDVHVAISEAIFVRHLAREFLETHKNANLSIVLMSNEQMRTGMREGTLDFVVSRGPIVGKDIFWHPMYEDTLYALMPPSHPLASRRCLRMEDLAQELFIVGDVNTAMVSYTYDVCHRAGFTPKIRYQGHESDVASMMLALDNAIMLAFASTTHGVSAELPAGAPPVPGGRGRDVYDLVLVPIVDAQGIEPLGLGFRSGRYQSAAVLDFYEMLETYYKNLPKSLPSKGTEKT